MGDMAKAIEEFSDWWYLHRFDRHLKPFDADRWARDLEHQVIKLHRALEMYHKVG